MFHDEADDDDFSSFSRCMVWVYDLMIDDCGDCDFVFCVLGVGAQLGKIKIFR